MATRPEAVRPSELRLLKHAPERRAVRPHRPVRAPICAWLGYQRFQEHVRHVSYEEAVEVTMLLVLIAFACRTSPPETEPSPSTVPEPSITEAPEDFEVERPNNETCRALPRPQPASSINIEPAFGDFWVDDELILALTQAPNDDDHWYIATRGGRVLRLSESEGADSAIEVLDLSARIEQHLEGGLLGLAFSPDFATNGVLYTSYTTDDSRQVTRWVSPDGGESFANETVVLEQALGYGFHVGGDLHVDVDGYLLYALGDGGNFFTAIDLQHLGGKIVRIDPEGNDDLPAVGELRVRNYAIPSDNPSIPGALPEIFAYGLRNPYRITVDPLTNDVWTGDVGEDAWEEANRIVPGGHYGWPIKEGPDCFLEDPCDDPTLIDPVVVYSRDEGISIIGGHVYRGSSIPSLQGVFVFNEWLTGDTWGAFTDPETGEPVRRYIGSVEGGTVTWGQSNDGELYAAGFTVHRVTAGGTPEVPFPQKLSETGCASVADVTEPAPGLIPYTVQVPLWSDAADKRRFMALPEGGFIERTENGRWDLPIGTVLVKEFTADGVRVETRLMMRHEDGGWGFYTYRWDEDGQDATLVPTGVHRRHGHAHLGDSEPKPVPAVPHRCLGRLSRTDGCAAQSRCQPLGRGPGQPDRGVPADGRACGRSGGSRGDCPPIPRSMTQPPRWVTERAPTSTCSAPPAISRRARPPRTSTSDGAWGSRT